MAYRKVYATDPDTAYFRSIELEDVFNSIIRLAEEHEIILSPLFYSTAREYEKALANLINTVQTTINF